MKIVSFSDTHFHDFQQFANFNNDNGLNSRLLEQFDYLDFLKAIIEDKQPDAVLFGGDLVHNKGIVKPSILLHLLEKMLFLNNYQLYMIAGNHDMEDVSGYYNVVALFELFFENAVIPFYKDYILHNRILCVSYQRHLQDFLDILQQEKGNYDVVLCHMGIMPEGGKKWHKSDIYPSELREVIGNDVYVLNGHNHVPFIDGKIIALGSCMRHNFSDINREALTYYIDTDTGEIETFNFDNIKFVDLEYPHPDGNDNIGDLTGCYVRCYTTKLQRFNAERFLEKNCKGYIIKIVDKNKLLEKKHKSSSIDDIVLNTIKQNYDSEKSQKLLDIFNKIRMEVK